MLKPASTQIKNILLLYPETPKNTYWSFSHSLGMIGAKSSTPPLGLLTVAGLLPRDEFETRLVDMNTQPLTDADIEWADIVFVSAMIAQKESFDSTLLGLKQAKKTVVVGGPHISTSYREVVGADCFFIGEAEGQWRAFLDDLRGGALKPAYASPTREKEYLELRGHFGPEANIVRGVDRPSLDLAPLPRFDLLRLSDYSMMPVQASRGCPVGCEFCDIWRRYGRKTRNKDCTRLTAELDELYRLGWRDTVFLVDDNFIGNRTRAREILRELGHWQRAHQRPFEFLTESTLSLADDDEILELMGDAGFTSVFVGIETPCSASLRETRKHINTVGSMADKVAKIQSRGIQIMSGFIIGFDSDPDDIAARMTACIQEMGIPQAMIGLLTALPDTDLHDRLSNEGRLIAAPSGNNTHNFTPNFRTARPMAAVVEDYKRVLDAAYPRDMKSFFQRCSVLRGRWPRQTVKGSGGYAPQKKVRAFWNYLRAVLASPYRLNALRFMLSTLLTKPSFFEQAVTLGVKGHHLWAITRGAFEVEDMRELSRLRLGEFAAFLGDKRDAIGEMCKKLQPLLPGVGTEVSAIIAYVRVNASGASQEMATLRWRIEDALYEIDQRRREIQGEIEGKYRHLSRHARKAFREEMLSFRQEADRLHGALCLPAAAPGTVS